MRLHQRKYAFHHAFYWQQSCAQKHFVLSLFLVNTYRLIAHPPSFRTWWGLRKGNDTSTLLLVSPVGSLSCAGLGKRNSLLPPYLWSSALIANVMSFSVISYSLVLSSPKCLIDLHCPASSLSLLATDKIKPVNVLESSSRSFLCALGCSCSLTLCCPLVQLWL